MFSEKLSGMAKSNEKVLVKVLGSPSELAKEMASDFVLGLGLESE